MSYTVVQAVVLDPAGQVYANATYSVAFVNLNTVPGAPPPTLGGSPFQTQIVGARCNANGFLQVVLADNTLVSPGPSQWRFSIVSAPYEDPVATYGFECQLTIFDGLQDITTQLQACAAMLPKGGVGTAQGIQAINGNNNPLQYIIGGGIASVSQPVPGTTQITVPPPPPAITSINGDFTPAQQLVAGAGIVITSLGNGVTVISLTQPPPPPTLISLVLNPTTTQGGNTVNGAVTLSGNTFAGGEIVQLSSSNPAAASVANSVLVPANENFANFPVFTHPVGADTTVTITGIGGGVTQTATLTVTAAVGTQPIYGGVGQPGANANVTLSGSQVTLSTGDILSELQSGAEQVGQSWQFSPNNQVIYLLLAGSPHTFVDQNNAPMPFNAPITVNLSGRTMYLYQTMFPLAAPFTVKVAS